MAKPKRTTSPKSDQPTKGQVEELAVTVAAILKNPACPDKLYTGITEALSEIETQADTLSVEFLRGLFLSKPRQAEGGAQ